MIDVSDIVTSFRYFRRKKDEDDLSISRPTNIQHNLHISLDPGGEVGLKGLPPEWEQMIRGNFNKDEVLADPKVIRLKLGGIF